MKKYFILFLLSAIFFNSKAQLDSVSIQTVLRMNGFENINVKRSNNTTYIGFENQKYRWQPKAISEVIALTKKLVSKNDTLIFISLMNDLPIVSIKQNMDSLLQLDIGGRQTKSSYQLLRKSASVNPTHYKFDLVIYPHLRTQFGNYDNPIEWQFGLAPMLTTSLWKGMSVNFQFIFLLHDNMQESSKQWIYPGTMTVNQLVKLPFDVFCNASAGFFLYSRFGDNFHRYGLDVQLRRFFNNGNFYIGANGSYTGQASFKTGVLEYWDPDLFLGNVCAAYRYSPYNIWLKATVGKFLYSDNGVRFDVNRQFHELQFGFFLVKSADFGHTIGFNFKIPIIPQKYFDHRLLRIRPANTFDWEFRANTVLPRVVQYKTGNDIDDRLINFNPDYVKDQVSKMLKE